MHQGQIFNRYVCSLGDSFVPDKNDVCVWDTLGSYPAHRQLINMAEQ